MTAEATREERGALWTQGTFLLQELDRHAAQHLDQRPGTSLQVCPGCSTLTEETLGTWTRATSRFECACGYRAVGDRYEDALYELECRRWRAEKTQRQLAAAARELRKAIS